MLYRNSKTAAGNQEQQMRKTIIALFWKVQTWARACSYDFRAEKGMENFTCLCLFVKVLLAPLLEYENHTQPLPASYSRYYRWRMMAGLHPWSLQGPDSHAGSPGSVGCWWNTGEWGLLAPSLASDRALILPRGLPVTLGMSTRLHWVP